MVHVFQTPLASEAWVYPCTASDLQERLSQFPPSDIEGLESVGLVPATARDHSANARYFRREKPLIHIYSHPATLDYKQPAHVRGSHIVVGLAREIEFGMRVEQVGSRWLCRWDAAALRRFILEHLLAHEIGHHVHYAQRQRLGLGPPPSVREGEQFAEAYALRMARIGGDRVP
jgi:hypothetical protein